MSIEPDIATSARAGVTIERKRPLNLDGARHCDREESFTPLNRISVRAVIVYKQRVVDSLSTQMDVAV